MLVSLQLHHLVNDIQAQAGKTCKAGYFVYELSHNMAFLAWTCVLMGMHQRMAIQAYIRLMKGVHIPLR